MKDKNTEVLKALIEAETKMNIRELSETLGMNYKNAYNIVMRLNKEGIVSLERLGQAVYCTLNKTMHPLVFQAEHERRAALLKKSDFRAIHEKLNSLGFPFIALVFGSFAKGIATKGSDIDLMAISEKNRAHEIESRLSLLPLKIHLVPLTYEEFMGMAKSKEFSVVSEAMKNNIILVGIEDYYRLV